MLKTIESEAKWKEAERNPLEKNLGMNSGRLR